MALAVPTSDGIDARPIALSTHILARVEPPTTDSRVTPHATMLTVAAARPVAARPAAARAPARARASPLVARGLAGARLRAPPSASRRAFLTRASADEDDASPIASPVEPISAAEGYASLGATLGAIRALPPSERAEAAEAATKRVSATLNGMKVAGATRRWDCYPSLQRRNVFPGEFSQMGIKDATTIGRPSDTNDFNFIVAVTLSTSFLALVVGATLPGDWGAFGSYLIGGMSLATLAVGSTAPGLLKVAIDRFARVNPEYRQRIAKHEAAHFLIGYMLGTPVAGYSLGLGTAHTDFLEAKLERKVYGRIAIKEETMLPLACISMAGVAAEAMAYEEVQGQEADLRDLQRILNKCEPKLSDAAQQAVTRWAVWQAASMLKRHEKSFDALTEKMSQGATVEECLQAIEAAPEPEYE